MGRASGQPGQNPQQTAALGRCGRHHHLLGEHQAQGAFRHGRRAAGLCTIAAQAREHTALPAEWRVAQQHLQAGLVAGAIQADQVVAQPPGDRFLKALQHHAVEAAEQGAGRPVLLPACEVVNTPELSKLAAGEIHADGVELIQPRVSQELLQRESPYGPDLPQASQHGSRGARPGDGVHTDLHLLLSSGAGQGLTGQQLAVAVSDQQQALAHRASSPSRRSSRWGPSLMAHPRAASQSALGLGSSKRRSRGEQSARRCMAPLPKNRGPLKSVRMP